MMRTLFLLLVLSSFACTEPADRPESTLPSQRVEGPSAGPTVVRLEGGRTVSLPNDFSHDYSSVRHEYRGVFPRIHYRLVLRRLYEGREYVLIHPVTGQQFTMPELPVLSPTGSRLVVASMDFEAGYAPNMLQIWGVTSDSLVLEWQQESGTYAPATGWAPSDPRWLDDETVRLRKNVPEDAFASTLAHTEVELVYTRPSGWHVRELSRR